jgi:hypothetical protein
VKGCIGEVGRREQQREETVNNNEIEWLVRGFGTRLREDHKVMGNVIPIELAWRLQELRRAEKARSKPPLNDDPK